MTEQAETKQKRAHVHISGRVQGVGFRWNAQHKAQELGLTGWVRNLWDGRVEAVFEGDEEAVDKAVSWCRHGERPARVEDVKINYEKPGGEFSGFHIKM